MREESGELVLDAYAREIGDRDVDVAAILPHELTAGAARRSRLVALGHDGDGGELALSGGQRGKQRDALRADRQSVGAVLDVAAAVDLAALCHQRGADFVLRERRDSVLASLRGFCDEFRHWTRHYMRSQIAIEWRTGALACPSPRLSPKSGQAGRLSSTTSLASSTPRQSRSNRSRRPSAAPTRETRDRPLRTRRARAARPVRR